MKVYKEISLFNDFEFWGGAKAVASRLTEEEMEAIETAFEDCFPDGMDEIAINDLFWFDWHWLLDLLEIDHDVFWNRGASIC